MATMISVFYVPSSSRAGSKQGRCMVLLTYDCRKGGSHVGFAGAREGLVWWCKELVPKRCSQCDLDYRILTYEAYVGRQDSSIMFEDVVRFSILASATIP